MNNSYSMEFVDIPHGFWAYKQIDLLTDEKIISGYPNDYFMPCFIGIGKPKKDASIIKQKDINVKDRIHWDRW